MWTHHRTVTMINQNALVPAFSKSTREMGRRRRVCAIPCWVVAMLLIGACDKSGTSTPKKPPTVEGPQQAADSDKPKKPDKPSDVFRYVNRDSGFAIDFPATWVRSSDPDGLFVIQASSPQEHPQDAFSENVYVMVKDLPQVMVGNQPQQLSLNDYFDLSRANFPKISNDAVEKEIGQIMINDQICPWVIFTHVFNSATWQTIRYYLRHEKRVYVIACTATPESFPRYEDAFQQIANSITFE